MSEPTSPEVGRAAAPYLDALSVAVAAAVALVLVWFGVQCAPSTAVVVPPQSAIAVGIDADLYPLLARGFLKHHLYLDAAVPADLARAADPFRERPGPHLHDASLYHGRYYAYFGPAPAALLFLPYRLLTGRDLSSATAVVVFCLLAYFGLIALYRAALRPTDVAALVRTWPAVLLTLGGASCLFPLLRRPAFYEVAIAAAAAFFVWSFYFLFRLPRSRRPAATALAAGLLLGLAAASRATYVLCFLPLAAGVFLLHRPESPAQRWRNLAAAAAGFGAICGLLAFYNALRFGSPFEFGDRYQLSGGGAAGLRHFSPSLLPLQAKTYLFSPLRLSRYYPFFHFVPPLQFPPGYLGNEYAFGYFANLPTAIFALIASGVALRRPGAPQSVPVILLLGATFCLLFPLLLFLGSAVRYLADFGPALAVISALGMSQVFGWAGKFRPTGRRAVSLLAGVCALASFAVVFLASVDMYDRSPWRPPPAFDRLGAPCDRPAVRWDWAHGCRYGPRQLALQLPPRISGIETLVSAAGPAGENRALGIEYAGAESIRFVAWNHAGEPTNRSPPIALDRHARHQVMLSLGAFLPLRPEEMRRPPSPERFDDLRVWIHVELDGRVVWEAPTEPPPWRASQIGSDLPGGVIGGKPFSGRILSEAVLPAAGIHLNRPAVAGIGLHVDLTADSVGRVFPLCSTGGNGRANLLLLSVESGGTIRFGYDHWGKPTLWSDSVAAKLASSHQVEFWMPSILNHSPSSPLVVRWDGRTAWKVWVPYFPARRNEVFPGRNPVGGSTCEPKLIGATFDSLTLPLTGI